MEIYSKSGSKIKKVYSETKNSIDIQTPCLSLTGNATPIIFDAIKEEDFNTGIMQRFDFWCYDGLIPERGFSDDDENKDLLLFAEALCKIREAIPITEHNFIGLRGSRFAPFKIGITEKGGEILQAWSKQMTAKTNAAGSDGEAGIISRAYNLCIKYAMIHHAATSPIETLFLPLNEKDIDYGKKVAWMLADWKINVLRGRVTTGDFHRDCEIFKEAIKAVIKANRRPTLTMLASKRPQIKNWKTPYSDEVIAVLSNRGEIVPDQSKGQTAYQLPKHSQRVN